MLQLPPPIPSALFLSLALAFAGCGGNGDGGGSNGADGGGDGDGGGLVGDGGATAADAAPHEIGPLGPGVATLAGATEPGFVDGPRDVALLDNPVNLAVGPDGNIYVCDFNNSAIRRVTPEGMVSTVTAGGDFIRPFGIAFTDDGELYVQTDRNTVDEGTGALWRIDYLNDQRTLVADDIGRTRGMAALSDGRLVLADYQAHDIRLYDPDTGVETPLAGMAEMPGYSEGTGTGAHFNVPYDVVLPSDDQIVVADLLNHRIRSLTIAGSSSTLAGDGNGETRDGDLATARFNEPKALAIGPDGIIYVTDTASATIRAIDLDEGVTTIAGSGIPGFGDSENPLQAQFFAVEGIDIDGDGDYLYVADGNQGTGEPYHRIRRISLADDDD